MGLSFKNTKNNADKYLLFTEQIIKTSQNVEDYVKHLGDLSKRTITQEQLDDFYLRLTGTNKHEYDKAHGIVKKNFELVILGVIAVSLIPIVVEVLKAKLGKSQ